MFFVEPTNRFLDLDEPFMWTLGDQVAEETHTKTHSVPRVQFEVKVLTSVQSRSGTVPLANLLRGIALEEKPVYREGQRRE